ncbi:GTPase activating factor [Xanthoria calcicola]
MTKARQRLGSLQPSANQDDEDNDNTSSIGFPSVIPSPPPETERHGPRRRLVKPQSRPLSPVRGSHSIRRTGSNASSATDVSKVLQLMKTTCGRMHGILSFRISGSASWSSGYCAINVATGSLIYQTKGDVAHAKTLIPDLRGCQVRTLYDDESRSTLEVSNHTTMIGVHLRPHVAETFDSWLAALLCWQPIRPKGANNHMAKANAGPTSERKTVGSRRTSDFGDRRRNSEIFPHKDAAIIKVGRMLMWDKDFRNGISTPSTNRRVSTYRQQRSLSTSWRKVSCTLQENGHFKLYAEADVAMVSMLPLCQLQRCSVQRLHPSVLDDEFCIAIYPQYASSIDKIEHPTPVYLSLESRVLFEVWFVLLRAFTIPELYGPEQISGEPQLASVEAIRNSSRAPSPSVDMFRIEKLLALRIIEAKMYPGRKRHSRRSSTKPLHQDQSRKTLLPGNYFAEVRLDGMVRGKTAVKHETGNPFWREDFQFTDLPPVLSSASIEIKTRNPGQKDWTLVSDGPLDLERAQLDPRAIVGDIEISPLESTYGIVELQFDENEHAVKTEKWWPIINDAGDILGETLMELRIEESVVLMGKDYQPLSELLHAFSNSLTVQIARAFPPDVVRKLAEILLNVFQVSAQASEWLLSLVEDEIDNIHKETHHSRYRYGRRIASNDSFESGIEREVIVRDLSKSAVVEANQLFRGNTLLTKALDCHMKRLGHDYLEETLGEKIRNVDESNPNCEVDPNRVRDPDDLQSNWKSLSQLIESVWSSIYVSALRCPPELRMIFRHIAACAEDRYGDFLRTITYSSVSGFLFLRFFCPALLNPHLFGLLKDHPRPQAQRTLTLISKTLNTLANLGTFGSKEPWMEPMNGFLNSHRQEFKTFVDTICAISPGQGTSPIPPSYATPITILGRLPGTSREGFPSLPYLIDQAKECATLVDLWLDRPHDLDDPVRMSDELQSFNDMCVYLREKTKHCVSRAEQAERPSGLLEPQWEELVEQMGRNARIRMANEQKATESKVDISSKDGRRRSRLRIEPDNDPPAARSRNPKLNDNTQNSSTASLVSSYFHRNHDSSREASRRGTPLDSTSTLKAASSEEGNPRPAATAPTANRRLDEYELDVEGTGMDTPPGSSSAVWDPGVLRGQDRYRPVTASSGEDRGFGSEQVDTDFTEAGSSIYRIGTPAASSRGQRHHRSSHSSSKHRSSQQHHHHRAANRSGSSIDATPELSSIPNRSPLGSRDGARTPPNGKSIYRLQSPMTTSERQPDYLPRSGTPRTPGSREGGKHLFPDFGSVFRKKGREHPREEGGLGR